MSRRGTSFKQKKEPSLNDLARLVPPWIILHFTKLLLAQFWVNNLIHGKGNLATSSANKENRNFQSIKHVWEIVNTTIDQCGQQR